MVKINWTFQALEDLTEIGDYHDQFSSNYSIKLVNDIFNQSQRLLSFPKLGRKVPEFNLPIIREIIFNKY